MQSKGAKKGGQMGNNCFHLRIEQVCACFVRGQSESNCELLVTAAYERCSARPLENIYLSQWLKLCLQCCSYGKLHRRGVAPKKYTAIWAVDPLNATIQPFLSVITLWRRSHEQQSDLVVFFPPHTSYKYTMCANWKNNTGKRWSSSTISLY